MINWASFKPRTCLEYLLVLASVALLLAWLYHSLRAANRSFRRDILGDGCCTHCTDRLEHLENRIQACEEYQLYQGFGRNEPRFEVR